jgi:hypothetical protein
MEAKDKLGYLLLYLVGYLFLDRALNFAIILTFSPLEIISKSNLINLPSNVSLN